MTGPEALRDALVDDAMMWDWTHADEDIIRSAIDAIIAAARAERSVEGLRQAAQCENCTHPAHAGPCTYQRHDWSCECGTIDRWGDEGPCGFVHPGGTPCLIERYKHPNVVAIGHRWKVKHEGVTPTLCAWTERCDQPREAHAHTQPWDMHPGRSNHAFVPPTDADR